MVVGLLDSTQVLAAVVIGLLVDSNCLELDREVAEYWPEFAAAGKGDLTVRQVLAHRAGVFGPSQGFAPSDLMSGRGARYLAAARPDWPAATLHGYSPLTTAIVMSELAARVSGRPLGAVFSEQVAARVAGDLYIGLPHAQEQRFGPLLLPPGRVVDPAIGLRLRGVGLNAPNGLLGLPNEASARRSGAMGVNGVGSARGLSALYGALLDGRLLSPETLTDMTAIHADGLDEVLGTHTRFGIAFELPTGERPFGGRNAYGHSRSATSLGYADPGSGVAFGFTCVGVRSSRLHPSGPMLSGAVDAVARGRTCELISADRLATQVLGR
jgi:CubicO group peptidase (beta-lactamase class C family)